MRFMRTFFTQFVGYIVASFALLSTSVGLCAEDRFNQIPIKIQAFVEEKEIAGAVMLVATKERVLQLSAVGQSDLGSDRKMKVDDLFWIASMTKPMTAVALAILKDERRLSFDDPIEKYLPEFGHEWVIKDKDSDTLALVQAARPITLRDGLTHTSGLGEYPVTDPHWTLAEMTKIAAREPLRFQPGSRWEYSTAGIDALGRVIEVVSGMSFAEFMQKRIFDPLGMKNTTFWLTPAQEKRFAHNYRRNAETGSLEEAAIAYMYGGAITDHARPPLGGAGLFSTAEDVARFYQMMLDDGVLNGHRILKPETVAEMHRKQTGDLTTRPGMPWGLGFCVIEDPSQLEA